MRQTFLTRTLSAFLFCLLSLPVLTLPGVISPAFAQEGEGTLNNTPPKGITVEELIQRFAAKEKEFKLAREQYTWTQSVKVQTLEGSTVDGEYQQVADVVFDDRGRRVQQVKFAPQNTLSRISMTQEDIDDIEKRMPFTMTIDDLPYYDVKYLGQQQEDELNCYVFDLSPKKIEKGQRYFEGRIWVDDHDYQIVKTFGKNVPDLVKPRKGEENLFPRFTTWREQIDGKYWFPTYTKVDDNLHFTMGDVHIRQVVKYENYRRFGSKTKIIFEGQEIKGADTAPKSDKADDKK
jgi:molybdopterin converting factor small subunit